MERLSAPERTREELRALMNGELGTAAGRGDLVRLATPRAAIVAPKAFGGLLRAIEDYEGTPETRAALELLALTFARPGELRAAEWAEFNLDAAVWEIPAGRMKMRKPHRVPLAPRAVSILEERTTPNPPPRRLQGIQLDRGAPWHRSLRFDFVARKLAARGRTIPSSSQPRAADGGISRWRC